MTLVHVLINKIVQFVKVHKYPAVVQICEAYFPLQGYSVRQIRRKKCGSGFVSITNGYENQSIMEILQQGVYKTVFMLSLRINHSLFFFLSFFCCLSCHVTKSLQRAPSILLKMLFRNLHVVSHSAELFRKDKMRHAWYNKSCI